MSDTVWVQVGKVGVRVPKADGPATAGELMARALVGPGQADVGSIHDGDCPIGLSLMETGGGICTCSPIFVRRPPYPAR